MNRRVAVRALILRGNEVLCVRQKHYHEGVFNDVTDYWCTPGGGVDEAEALIPALEREMIEELGVKPVIGNLLYVQQFLHGGSEHLEFFFHITNYQDYENIDLSKTTHGEAEIAALEFIDPATQTEVRPAFMMSEDIAAQAALGSTKFFNYLRPDSHH